MKLTHKVKYGTPTLGMTTGFEVIMFISKYHGIKTCTRYIQLT